MPSVGQLPGQEDIDKLNKLFNELKQFSESIPCEDEKKWRLAPIGQKPCGGPARYIAYSSTMDTLAFMKKVDQYTSESIKYNQKWKPASNCAVVNPPKLRCENGRPVLY